MDSSNLQRLDKSTRLELICLIKSYRYSQWFQDYPASCRHPDHFPWWQTHVSVALFHAPSQQVAGGILYIQHHLSPEETKIIPKFENFISHSNANGRLMFDKIQITCSGDYKLFVSIIHALRWLFNLIACLKHFSCVLSNYWIIFPKVLSCSETTWTGITQL